MIYIILLCIMKLIVYDTIYKKTKLKKLSKVEPPQPPRMIMGLDARVTTLWALTFALRATTNPDRVLSEKVGP
jgi:hypothetical protein